MPSSTSSVHRPSSSRPDSDPAAAPPTRSTTSTYDRRRHQTKALLSSWAKHYFLLGLVSLDVTAILIDLLIELVACNLGSKDEAWWTGPRGRCIRLRCCSVRYLWLNWG
ncbi:hypothetical protein N657DRAFT_640546 [Parathielavia appendiculata]|uniref:Uncharacterized protein n=1 Tax=Parathielavia appendiculata TaxID=2587402 RepID=A0AAN6U640_9PEZI|nr:hypothetical protein N657DRAFT_640546 [Parathielavia appendiculata]